MHLAFVLFGINIWLIVAYNISIVQDAAVECSIPKGKCLGSQSTLRFYLFSHLLPPSPLYFHRGAGSYFAFRNCFLCSTHSSQEGMQRSKPHISPGELIEAIFTVPARLEEPKLRRYELGANRSRVLDQKPVLKPLEDISTYSTDFPVKVTVGSKGILSILLLSFFSEFRLIMHFIRNIVSKSLSSCLLLSLHLKSFAPTYSVKPVTFF